MPQMGESIAEGTVVRWLKKVGDSVERDEPLFEISTDKVDAEIPSPAAGVLTEIKVSVGETVAVNSVVATIGAPGEAAASPPDPGKAAPAADRTATTVAAGKAQAAASTQQQGDGQPSGAPTPSAKSSATQPGAPRGAINGGASASPSAGQRELTRDEVRRQKSSPLVRRIAREHNVDIGQIPGSGIGGRVTKHDILGYIEQGPTHSHAPSPAAATPTSARPAQPATTPGPEMQAPTVHVPAYSRGDRVDIQPMTVMRKKIAEHMILSRRTSAHVHSVFHVDFSKVDKIRQQRKAEYERLGTKLTFMSFIGKAVIDAIRRHPVINSSIDGDNIVYKQDVNLGVAVALENGLIVPVIKNADEKNMLGLSRAIADVAARARSKQLKPEEVQGGTFTVTNPGTFGAQFGMPIINQPQVAILGVGIVEKRPVVIDDAIAIRTMAYLTLGYDHRLIDGAVADQFMSDVKNQIENFDPNQV
jgi:pyruvate dehydrogenase E2 component (dihydrolipoamide acetyltransferase)